MRFSRFRLTFTAAVLALAWGLTGCSSESDSAEPELPALETKADSVAMQMYQSLGGPSAWAAAPYLRFNFGIERNGEEQVVARHLWDRQSGDYRLEWSTGPDSSFVALFNVDAFGETASEQVGAQAGSVYLNGESVDSAATAQRMTEAHRRFVNDTYWLLAPLKVFDPGVNRSYVADSSDAEHDVITITFGEVGLTPGDQYWMYVDTETGRLDRWAYHLQNMPEDASPRFFDWTGYETFKTPDGAVQLATRKESAGGPVAILTNALDLPTSVPSEMFTDTAPRLE